MDDDLHLVRRAASGSREAAGALVDRHWRSCWRAARGILGDPVAAEDVVQEALISALRKIGDFDPERGRFAAWLHRITVNRALTEATRRRRHGPLDEAAGHEAPSGGLDGDGAFLSAIAGLEPDHRAVVVLRYGLDYTPPEIAAVLDLPVGTVHSRLSRALGALRQTTEPPHVR
ncbi:MAG: RNA polymerase sigma factor [Thermoleophilia bacterium]